MNIQKKSKRIDSPQSCNPKSPFNKYNVWSAFLLKIKKNSIFFHIFAFTRHFWTQKITLFAYEKIHKSYACFSLFVLITPKVLYFLKGKFRVYLLVNRMSATSFTIINVLAIYTATTINIRKQPKGTESNIKLKLGSMSLCVSAGSYNFTLQGMTTLLCGGN